MVHLKIKKPPESYYDTVTVSINGGKAFKVEPNIQLAVDLFELSFFVSSHEYPDSQIVITEHFDNSRLTNIDINYKFTTQFKKMIEPKNVRFDGWPITELTGPGPALPWIPEKHIEDIPLPELMRDYIDTNAQYIPFNKSKYEEFCSTSNIQHSSHLISLAQVARCKEISNRRQLMASPPNMKK